MENFKIKSISLGELSEFEAQIRKTANRAFKCPGYDEDVMADLKAKADPVIKIHTDFNGRVVGFGYGYIAQTGTLASFLKQEQNNLPHSMLSADKTEQIGIIKTIVTDPSHQCQGLATKLVREIEKDLLQKNATEIIVPAWKAGDRINIGRTMDRAGYTEGFTVEGFWKKDCDSGDFQCIDRTDQCICSAVFYTKTVSLGEK